jgi:hypothetical protein
MTVSLASCTGSGAGIATNNASSCDSSSAISFLGVVLDLDLRQVGAKRPMNQRRFLRNPAQPIPACTVVGRAPGATSAARFHEARGPCGCHDGSSSESLCRHQDGFDHLDPNLLHVATRVLL